MANLSLAFDILARDKASKTLAEVGDNVDKTGDRMSKFNKIAGAAFAGVAAGVGALAVSGVKAASALEQSSGAIESVFGEAADAVAKFASSSAVNVGLSTSKYQELAAVVGSQMIRLGQSQDEAALSTDKLISLGADLSATFGGSVSDAVGAVGALLRGERDPIERYAVGIKDADVQARLAADGLGHLKGAALEQAKAQATLALLFDQTKSSAGTFAKESGTLAGQQQILGARFEDVKAKLATALLPVITGLIDKFLSLTDFVKRNQTTLIALGAVIGTLTAITAAYSAIMAVQAAGGLLAFLKGTQLAAAASKVFTAVQAALNLVLSLNPIGLVVIAIAALVAGLVIAYKNSETFRNIVAKLFEGLKKFIGFTPLGALISNFDAIRDAVEAVIRKIGDLAGKIRDLPGVGAIGGALGKIPGFAGGGTLGPGLSMVGEDGPELVYSPRGGQQVYSNRQSAAMVQALQAGDAAVMVEVRDLMREQNALLRRMPKEQLLLLRQRLT